MLRSVLFSILLGLLSFTPAAFASRDFLVDTDWLANEQANNPKPVLLEARYHPHRHTTVGHIAGAVQRVKDLGYEDVRRLNGAWAVWERAFTLPVVTGDQPYDEGFAL